METAAQLTRLGVEVVLVEKNPQLGGHLNQWDRLFPNRRDSREVLVHLEKGISGDITLCLDATVSDIGRNDSGFNVLLGDGRNFTPGALVMATGFEVFDARKKEEYGYGIYDNVITSAELEDFLRNNKQKNTF